MVLGGASRDTTEFGSMEEGQEDRTLWNDPEEAARVISKTNQSERLEG